MSHSGVRETARGAKSQRSVLTRARDRRRDRPGEGPLRTPQEERSSSEVYEVVRDWRMGKAGSRTSPSKGREAGKPVARPVVGCGGCKMRGWEHGAGESPFLGQAGGGCGAGGAFLAGRAAGTNVFPTWPRIPGSARSHGQDTPAATPAPAASFPQRGERGRECGGGCGTGLSWGAAGACALASQGPAPRAACAPRDSGTGQCCENKSRVGRWNRGRKEARTAMDPWPRPCFSGPRSPAPALWKARGQCGWRAQRPDWRRVVAISAASDPTPSAPAPPS